MLGDVIVVGPANGRGQFLVFQIEDPNQRGWINDLKIDLHLIQVLQAAFDVVE